jgi:hypothetical protein
MSHRRTPFLAFAIPVVLLATACNRASPTAPQDPPGPAIAASTTGGAPVFGLIAGSFELVSPQGAALSGTYSGHAQSIGRRESANITVTLTGGSGEFDGVAGGVLIGSGTGAFTGEGSFSLTLQGAIPGPRGTKTMRVVLHGTSTLACSAGTVIVLQQGAGSVAGLGRVSATSSHQLTNAGCL